MVGTALKFPYKHNTETLWPYTPGAFRFSTWKQDLDYKRVLWFTCWLGFFLGTICMILGLCDIFGSSIACSLVNAWPCVCCLSQFLQSCTGLYS